jgi:acyl-CoA synthetase (AMP-forming)/AMP-acid ligase II
VHHYYGAAELSFVAWGTHAEDLRPFPGVDVDVRDGEIWVRSPYLFSRYDGPPGALRRDADGFATVGDRGSFDAGLLVVRGRPEGVTTGGTTVLVADVEAALRPHARGDLVVVGVPHAELGEVLAVVLGDEADRSRVEAVARDALDGASRPRLWLHLPDLPLTDAGKVDRAAVARLAAGRRH